MALVIRLRRQGARKRPFFRIVVAESSAPRDGRCVAQIGTYDPASDPPKVSLKADQVERWLKVGAQPSSTVKTLLGKAQQQTVTA
jgi:small subunit ribosomal protein S16